ncbi:MAG: efflux RND transporter permease subunit [Candidatus Schekmanbacteria bacterium]|nr:MAG: efflux RND transporter permease subunit [Candidatus Schekmanbacteria bacterium]
MLISEISINRPVFAVMMIASLMVLGIASISYIGVQQTPEVNPPYITVTTAYPGASPAEVESTVTKPLEEAVSSVNGIKKINSITTEGLSRIILEFDFDMPIKIAAIEVREKVFQKKSELPEDVKEPVIQRMDPAQRPIMWVGVSAPRDPAEIRDIAENEIKPALEQVENVASVDIIGGLEREIQVYLKKDMLNAYGITPFQVMNILKRENINLPAGRVEKDTREIVVRTRGEFSSVDEIGNVVVSLKNGVPIYLRDIADIEDGFKDLRSLSRINDVDAVSMGIKKQSGTNTVALCNDLYDKIDELRRLLPSDFSIFIIRDDSIMVREDVRGVRNAIIEGVIMAVLVVFIFMRDWRSTLICALSLPTSLISTFFFMYLMGFTINVMTLMALNLVVGVVIDDAIVVRENIFRHMEEGMAPKEAASFGTSEIGLAVMATTFSIVAVFIPIAFMSGMIGRWFKSFGLTAAFAVLVSLFVSFTLDPMLSAYFMKPVVKGEKKKRTFFSKLSETLEKAYSRVDSQYRDILSWTTNNNKTVILGAIAIFVLSLFMLPLVGVTFFEDQDRGEISVTIKMPAGTSLKMTDMAARKAEKMIRKNPEVKTIFTAIGQLGDVTNAHLDVYCTDKNHRITGANLEELKSQIRQALKDIPAEKITVETFNMGGRQEAPITLYVRGDDMPTLAKITNKILPIVKATPGTVDVSSTIQKGRPELEVVVDRNIAGDIGLNNISIASSLRSLIEGEVPSKFRDGDNEYDIRVRLAKADRDSLEDIGTISFLQDKEGRNIFLKEIAELNFKEGPSEIRRENRQREVLIESNYMNASLGDVISNVRKRIKDVEIPEGYKVGFTGQAERMEEAFSTLTSSLLLAVVFIYMVLASQFNSFIHPFTIMLSLPLAIIGAVLILFVFGLSFSISTMFAFIMLMGLVTKNAILLVDYTNVLRERGLPRREAILQAGPTRLRPILMTTLAMIFGMLPVAVSNEPGSEFRSPMAISIIGGLLTSMFLTLVVVPSVYSVLDDLKEKFKLRRK